LNRCWLSGECCASSSLSCIAACAQQRNDVVGHARTHEQNYSTSSSAR
jgi:hypothetical protein